MESNIFHLLIFVMLLKHLIWCYFELSNNNEFNNVLFLKFILIFQCDKIVNRTFVHHCVKSNNYRFQTEVLSCNEHSLSGKLYRLSGPRVSSVRKRRRDMYGSVEETCKFVNIIRNWKIAFWRPILDSILDSRLSQLLG